MPKIAFVLTLALAPLTAQEALTARDFLLPDYKNVIFADLAAMRERGIWEELQASVLKLAFAQIEKEIGFPLDHLDRLTMVQDPGDPDEGGKRYPNRAEVRVLEGNAALGLPESVTGGSWREEHVGRYDVMRRDGFRDEVVFSPRANLQVGGTTTALMPALQGERRTAMPCADVMSLVSGRKQSLAYVAINIGHPSILPGFSRQIMPDAEWPEGDQPTFMCLRLLATGDDDDPHLTVELVLRHQQAGQGIEVTAEAADRFLDRLVERKELRLLRPLLKKVVRSRDRGDLTMRLDLGRARDAAGQLATLAVPMFLGAPDGAELQARGAQVEEEPPPPPPPPESKPKQNESGGGR